MSDPAGLGPVLRARLASQGLTGPPFTSAPAVVERLLAVQGQDPRGWRLSVRARSQGVTAADVVRELTEKRSLVISWLNRGTLHLVRSEDYWWLARLLTPRLAPGNARRLYQEGVAPEQAAQAVELMMNAVAVRGPLSRDQLWSVLMEAGLPVGPEAMVHLLAAAAFRAHLVRGPLRGVQHLFVPAETWIGPPPAPIDRSEALSRLARRYLFGHGPASDRDLAKWAGIGVSDARTGLAGLAGELSRTGDLFDLPRPHKAPDWPPPKLLGPFDPTLHGWESKELVLREHRQLVTTNGVFRPFLMVGGIAAGSWTLRAGRPELNLFRPLGKTALAALVEDAGAVLRYLGLPRADPIVNEPWTSREAGASA